MMAAERFNVKQIIVAGGVAENSGLRTKMNENKKHYELVFPNIKYCTDNAAMIGIAAYYQYQDLKMYDKMDLNGKPYSELGRK